MAVLLREVFIASNFEEFSELRAEIKQRIDGEGFARAIDLNQNTPDAHSPLRRSLGRIRSSDLVILLVGKEYGRDKPDGKRSYTHLEYREARAEGTPILVHFIGAGYSKPEFRPRQGDPNLHPLQKEVLPHRSVAFHDSDSDSDSDSDPHAIADAIVEAVRKALLYPDEPDAEGEEPELLARGVVGDHELDSLERDARPSNPFTSELELLQRPAEAATAEQLREAKRALEIRDRSAAIHHLRKALELRPLDLDAGYELGRLLLTSTRFKDLREASRLAERVARVAALDGNEVRRGFALALAASAEAQLENDERAVALARQATEAAGHVATVHIECASVYAKLGRIQQATEEALKAFQRHPASFWKLHRDPVLKRSVEFRALERELLEQTLESVESILHVEQDSLELERRLGPDADDGRTGTVETALASLPSLELTKAVLCGKDSARRTLQALRRAARVLPEKGRAGEALRAEASKLADEKHAIVTQPILPLTSPVDELCLWAPPLIAFLSSVGTHMDWKDGASLIAASLFGGWLLRVALRARQRSIRIQRELASQQEALEAAETAANGAEKEFGQLLERFTKLVRRFERDAVAPKRGIFSPSVGAARARAGELVRLRPKAPPKGFELDVAPFPPIPALKAPTPDSPTTKHQLFMILRRDGDRRIAARWACYFERPDSRLPTRLRAKLAELDMLPSDESRR
ncbi:MAG TPA: DUF4062 domain-containing protein [Polyangiaceae bacterium]